MKGKGGKFKLVYCHENQTEKIDDSSFTDKSIVLALS